jgi:hypothetical protein
MSGLPLPGRPRGGSLALLVALLAACSQAPEPVADNGVLNDSEATSFSEAAGTPDSALLGGGNDAGNSATLADTTNSTAQTGETAATENSTANGQSANGLGAAQNEVRVEKGGRRASPAVDQHALDLRNHMKAEAERESEAPWPLYAAGLILLALAGLTNWRLGKLLKERQADQRRIGSHLDRLEVQLDAVAAGVEALSEIPRSTASAPVTEQSLVREVPRQEADASSPPTVHRSKVAVESKAKPPAQPRSGATAERLAAIARAFSRMAPQTPALEDYEDALGAYGTLYDVTVDADKRVDLHGFTGGRANMLLAAIEMADGGYAVVPSFYFVKEFETTYHEATDSEPLLRGVFEMEKDNRKTLTCLSPALARSPSSGLLTVVEPGQLGGFTRAR